MRSILLIAIPLTLLAQYPQQNPNTYPNTYPPTNYPPNQYPNTYPGPGGVGIQIPGIHLPGRKAKTETSKPQVNVASIDGTLRKLAEKELLLQSAPNKVLRFRLLARTEFRDKSGKQVRDSLLHPGDKITVDANPDDPETALQVILVKAGSKSDRAAAEAPVDSSSTPDADDLGKPHNIAAPDADTTVPATTSDDERPVLTRKPEQQQQLIDPVIANARTEAANFSSDLPNFLVQQITTRYQGSRAIDIVTTDLASVEGKEEYTNIRINGRPSNAPPENSGSWSTGEFATTLDDILSPYTAAGFTKRGEDRIANRTALIYDMAVEKPRSHWILVAPDKSQYKPAYKGAIWIDKETGRVLRIEQMATALPSGYVYSRVESTLEYGFVAIEGKQYLLPISSENIACVAATGNCSRNVIQFHNYRKFGANSSITFDKFAKN